MKIKTIAEGHKNIDRARTDLQRCQWAQAIRDRAPSAYELHDRPELLQFYMSQWPNIATDPGHRKLWSDQLDLATEGIVKYIAAVEAWIATKVGKPMRSCLPLKKQRELGMIPKL